MREEIKKIKDKLRRKFGYHTYTNKEELDFINELAHKTLTKGEG